ncbi:MAG: YkgJ family cysteine cluster protein [Minicystis sp.]
MATKITAPEGQRFACKDCPARCCRLPARVRLTGEEAARYLAEPWVRERATEEGLGIIEGGALPVREIDGGPACVFLDDDMRCAMQKRFGHDYLPRTCQAFPFAFTRDEEGVIVAQLSKLCPSIRDDYGEPVAPQLRTKLQQAGGAARMAAEMEMLGGTSLAQAHYLRVVRRWEAALVEKEPAATTLARLYDMTLAFEGALPVDRITDAAVDDALGRAFAIDPEPLAPRPSPSIHARMLFASLLGHLCHPARVKLAHRIGDARGARGTGWRILANKVRWMMGWGSVDMAFIARPVRLGRVKAVQRFLAESKGALVTGYLRLVLQRRQVFAQPRHLLAVLIDLAIATTLASRFARCRAAAEERTRVTADDVREGIGVAELLVLGHVDPAAQGPSMTNLRRMLLTSRDALRGVLATEA